MAETIDLKEAAARLRRRKQSLRGTYTDRPEGQEPYFPKLLGPTCTRRLPRETVPSWLKWCVFQRIEFDNGNPPWGTSRDLAQMLQGVMERFPPDPARAEEVAAWINGEGPRPS